MTAEQRANGWSVSFLSALLFAVPACSEGNPKPSNGNVDGDGDNAGDADGSADGAQDADGSGDSQDADGDDGVGDGDGSGDGAGDGGVENCGALRATIRDFKSDHSDMERGDSTSEVVLGIVQTELGPDKKPVYAGPQPTTTDAATFAQWYTDVAGTNQAVEFDIPLTDQGDGLFVYDNAAFFPIDGAAFGNEGNPHNYHFTTEVHTRFTYRGGEVFTFTGDDDLWLFVNGKLAIDLGGLHLPRSGMVDFDAMADQLGITPNNTYDMDIFHAERHTVDSNFRIETSIDCFIPPVI